VVIVGVVGLAGVVAFLVWVVFREPWGPLRDIPRDPRDEGERRRRTLAKRQAPSSRSSASRSRAALGALVPVDSAECARASLCAEQIKMTVTDRPDLAADRRNRRRLFDVDQRALRDLFDQHAESIFAAALWVKDDRLVAGEITRRVFGQLWRGRDS
jgi:hypothetical protein